MHFKLGLKDGIPIALGYISIAFAFSMLALEQNLPLWSPLLMSLTSFTGSGQFAGIELIVQQASLFEIALTIFVINIRYILMSFALSQKLSPRISTWQRALIAFGNTDEVFAVSMQRHFPLTLSYMLGIIFISYGGWNLGTLAGVLASSIFPLSIRQAMGIALYSMFIALIIPPAKVSKPILKTIGLAFIASIAWTFIPLLQRIGSGWRIVICGVLAAALGAYFFPLKTNTEAALSSSNHLP